MTDKKEMNIANIMRDVVTISQDSNFRETLEKMISLKTNSLVVVDNEGIFVGMINSRILIQKAVPDFLETDAIAAHFADEEMFRDEVVKNENAELRDFMITDMETITASDSLMKASIVATQNQQIRIPVLDEMKKPIGLLTRTELKQVIGYYMNVAGSFE